jgi:hypothetical protein
VVGDFMAFVNDAFGDLGKLGDIFPITKNVALMPRSLKRSRSLSVSLGCGPSSNVMATVLLSTLQLL